MKFWYAILLAGIVLDHAHLASPVAVAWGNQKFRRRMLERPDKFILLPALILVVGVAYSASAERHDRAFEWLVGLYLLWNCYHFGMQNFGLLALWGYRRAGFVCLCITMMAGLPAIPGALPGVHLPVWAGLVLLFGLSFNHWIAAIWIAAKANQNFWLFVGAMLVIGFVGFFFKTVGCNNTACSTFMFSAPLLLGSRICLGFVHFLYDRWVWRSDSPVARQLYDASSRPA
jgi:hypothetical protein